MALTSCIAPLPTASFSLINMSVYGGDSWVPLASQRKLRIDDLLSQTVPEEELRRMANGRFACLVCPHNPVLDTLPMLVMHRKGAHHQAAAERLRDRQLSKQEEVQKRTALAPDSLTCEASSRFPSEDLVANSKSSPLLEATRKRTAQVLMEYDWKSQDERHSNLRQQNSSKFSDFAERKVPFFTAAPDPYISKSRKQVLGTSKSQEEVQSSFSLVRSAGQRISQPKRTSVTPQSIGALHQQPRQRERELKLRESGWRRDGFGGWFKEDDVEFDSDEEVPDGIS